MPFGAFGKSETRRLMELTGERRAAANAKDLAFLLEVAGAAKPIGYDAHQEKVRDFYEGRQEGYLRTELARRYEVLHGKMSAVPLNVTKATAELDAQVYRQHPARWLIVDGMRPGKVEVDPETGAEEIVRPDALDRQERFQRLANLARLDLVIPDFERKAMAARTYFGRIAWERLGARLGRPERPVIEGFWPSMVNVIPNPRKPGALWAADMIIAEIGGPVDDTQPGQVRWFELWWRANTLDETGEGGEFGQILVEQVSDEGESRGVREYPLRDFPWFVMQDAIPSSSIFVDTDRDITTFQDAVNVALTNWHHKDDMQGHSERWISGPQPKDGRTIVGGPAAWIDLPPDTQVGTLDYDHDLTTLDGLEKSLRMFGMSRRQSPDAWATEPGPPLSGISRIVSNIAPNQKRSERAEVFRRLEEEDLLPLLVQIADGFGRGAMGGTIGGPDASYRVVMAPPEEFEEPQARANRARFAELAGWISPARAAFEAGFYRSVAEAAATGLSEQNAEPGPPPSPIGGTPEMAEPGPGRASERLEDED